MAELVMLLRLKRKERLRNSLPSRATISSSGLRVTTDVLLNPSG